MPFEVKPSRPGQFAAELNIFLDDGYLRTHKVSVRGTAKNTTTVEEKK